MKKNYSRKELLPLFQKFISESKNGARIQKNGKRIAKMTIPCYQSAFNYLAKLSYKYTEPLSVNQKIRLNKKEYLKEKNYWLKFYRNFRQLMYQSGCTDNYVGTVIKVLRVFFRYLEIDKNYPSASFYKSFYAPHFEIPVIVLDQEKLRFLITDRAFDATLPPNLKSTKDLFIVGCTIGLRYSDLRLLKRKNIERTNNGSYIVIVSQKTSTPTRIKIPPYVEEIIKRYENKQSILPRMHLITFNAKIKKIGELANWTYEVGKIRAAQGVKKEMKTSKGRTYRYCDLLSSHVMRKTAITTLLLLGMAEPLVRKISGHAPNSKEFYKYVKYSQSFFDNETDRVFDLLLQESCV